MRRGTTPTFSFEVDMDLTGWDVYVTFAQGRVAFTRRGPEVRATEGGCVCEVGLSQAETLSLKKGKASAQLRAEKDGRAVASTVFEFDVGDVLLDGEIPQEV